MRKIFACVSAAVVLSFLAVSIFRNSANRKIQDAKQIALEKEVRALQQDNERMSQLLSTSQDKAVTPNVAETLFPSKSEGYSVNNSAGKSSDPPASNGNPSTARTNAGLFAKQVDHSAVPPTTKGYERFVAAAINLTKTESSTTSYNSGKHGAGVTSRNMPKFLPDFDDVKYRVRLEPFNGRATTYDDKNGVLIKQRYSNGRGPNYIEKYPMSKEAAGDLDSGSIVSKIPESSSGFETLILAAMELRKKLEMTVHKDDSKLIVRGRYWQGDYFKGGTPLTALLNVSHGDTPKESLYELNGLTYKIVLNRFNGDLDYEDSKGTLRRREQWTDGLLTGWKTFYAAKNGYNFGNLCEEVRIFNTGKLSFLDTYIRYIDEQYKEHVEQGRFRDGKKEGVWVYYSYADFSGVLKYQGSGKHRIEVTYKDGKEIKRERVGEWLFKYSKAKLGRNILRCKFKHGRKDGHWGLNPKVYFREGEPVTFPEGTPLSETQIEELKAQYPEEIADFVFNPLPAPTYESWFGRTISTVLKRQLN